MRVAVYGLWHLGTVTAACVASAGHRTVGLDLDADVVGNLQEGRPPLHEPGLPELVRKGLDSGALSFTTDPAVALSDADVLWVAFDTPVNDRDEADVGFVRSRLESIGSMLCPGTVVLISSQVPVGFTASLEAQWRDKGLRFAYSPENLRLGKAIEVFTKPDRVIIGRRRAEDEADLRAVFAPYAQRIEWMSVESAEMTKHAINAFLATSVTFINELARLCEQVGADAKDVERGLKSESRIGPKAYLSPGVAFAGGTLARDVRFLVDFGRQRHQATPLFEGVMASNAAHSRWVYEKVEQMLSGVAHAKVAVLGLTYKPGTNTLRRSSSVELCLWLASRGVEVQAHDPALSSLPENLSQIHLCNTAVGALAGASVAVVATEWPDYLQLKADDFLRAMQRPQVVDPNWFLRRELEQDGRIVYFATGRPVRAS